MLRGAVVKALAICTHLHYFQIFKVFTLIHRINDTLNLIFSPFF